MTRDERQIECIKKWKKAKGRGILECCTGFGKTYMSSKLALKFLSTYTEATITIIVPTNILKKQMLDSLHKMGIYERIIVTTAKSALLNPDKYNCDLLIVDELHTICSISGISLLNSLKFKLFLGLTATLERLDNRHLILTKVFPIIDTVTLEDALENGWVSPVKIYKVLIDPEDIHIYNESTDKFNQYFTYFNHNFDMAMKCIGKTGNTFRKSFMDYKYPHRKPSEEKELMKIITANAFGFIHEMSFRKKYIYNHPKKIEICEKILSKRLNRKSLVLCETIKMADKIKPPLDNIYTLHSGKTKKKNAITVDEFNEISEGVLKAGKMGKEGLDILGLNLGIVVSFNSSKSAAVQSLGRIIRAEEGKVAEMFVLVLNNTVEKKWFETAYSNRKNIITIDEEQLEAVLDNKPFISLVDEEAKFTFRY